MILKSRVQSLENPGKRIKKVANNCSKLVFDFKSDSEDKPLTLTLSLWLSNFLEGTKIIFISKCEQTEDQFEFTNKSDLLQIYNFSASKVKAISPFSGISVLTGSLVSGIQFCQDFWSCGGNRLYKKDYLVIKSPEFCGILAGDCVVFAPRRRSWPCFHSRTSQKKAILVFVSIQRPKAVLGEEYQWFVLRFPPFKK